MIRGVVIWYSALEYKALIWCEDSGALAFATGPTSWRNPMVEIAVGDCVGFVAEAHGRERKCRDIHLIASQVAPDLPLTILPAPSRGGHLSLCASPARGIATVIPETPAGRTAPRGNPLLHLCATRE